MKWAEIGMDQYDRHARLKPALLCLLPGTLTCAVLVPGDILGWSGAAAATVHAGGTFLLAQVVGDVGKRREPELYRLWGGRPTEISLSHRHAANKISLATRHAKMATLLPGVSVPSAEDEESNFQQAMEVYGACTGKLRSIARDDSKRGSAVLRENIHYGFRRNLWALKRWGIALSAAALTVLGTVVGANVAGHASVDPVAVGVLVVDALFLLGWLLFVNPEWVRRAAVLYSERLLELLDSI